MQISINNWDKYNERKDRKSAYWFRFQNDFFLSNTMFGCDPILRIVFIYLLCEQSRSSEPYVDLNIDRAVTLTKVNEIEFINNIQALVDLGVISAQNRADSRKMVAYKQTNNTIDRWS